MDASNLFARARIGWLSEDFSNTASNSTAAFRSPIISKGEAQGDSSPERGPLSSGRYISFGPFRVDQRTQELSRDGARIKLQGKVYRALLTLLERPGEIITREDLRVRLWPDDTHVNYDASAKHHRQRTARGPRRSLRQSRVCREMFLGAGIMGLWIHHATSVP